MNELKQYMKDDPELISKINEYAKTRFEFDGASQPCTIKEYLKLLLITLWEEADGFCAKRPFGNSGWDCDIYKTMIEFGLIQGKIDECGYIDDLLGHDEAKGSNILKYIIGELE